MSVCLIVTRPKDREYSNTTFPLAAEDVYERYWLPGAQEIGASWLPLFQTGVPVTGEHFEEVSIEAVSFRNWLQSQPFDEDLKREITSRVDLLLDGLKSLYNASNGDIELFIG